MQAFEFFRNRDTNFLIIAVGLLAAAGAGIAAAMLGLNVLIWIALPVAAVLIMLRPELGLIILAGSIPIENVLVFGDEITSLRLLGMFVTGVWLFRKLIFNRENLLPVFDTKLTRLVVPFIFYAALSLVWSTDPEGTYSAISQLIRLALLSFVCRDLLSSWNRLDLLAKAMVIGGLVASWLTLRQGVIEGARRAGMDVAGGINATAATLVIIIPFAFYLLIGKNHLVWRLAGGIYLVLATIGVGYTLSRMSFLMLPLVLLVYFWETIKKKNIIILVALIVGFIYITSAEIFPKSRIQDRASSIGDYISATFAGADETTSARGYAQRVGIAIFLDHPILGGGYESFRDNFKQYRWIVPGAPGNMIYTHPRVGSHDSYMGILADLGLIGIIFWASILGTGLSNLLKAYFHYRKGNNPKIAVLVQTFLYGFCVLLVYGFTINIHREKFVWLFLGLGLALQKLYEQERESSGAAENASALERLPEAG